MYFSLFFCFSFALYSRTPEAANRSNGQADEYRESRQTLPRYSPSENDASANRESEDSEGELRVLETNPKNNTRDSDSSHSSDGNGNSNGSNGQGRQSPSLLQRLRRYLS